jgi:septum formation protein
MGILHSRIYLASQSPRYRDSLKQIGVSFESLLLRHDPRRSIVLDEPQRADESIPDYLERFCRVKAVEGQQAFASRNLLPLPVLAADSVLVLDDKVIGKPHDPNESAAMLHVLSGREHQLISAVAVAFQSHVTFRLTRTTVTFTKLDDDRIAHYVLSNEGSDRAGAYAIDGFGAAFVTHIQGSHSALFGLPLFETVELLREAGLPVG